MKRIATGGRKSSKLPIAWREAEYAGLRAKVTDTWEDRVSENLFDAEDERAEVDIIVHAMSRGEN